MTPERGATRTLVAGGESVRLTAPFILLRAVWAARTIVRALVLRDLRGRYVGSMLGTFWSIAHPLVQLATYTFVFSTVLKVKVTPLAGTDVPFALYLACGLFPWLAVQEAVTRSATCLVDNPTLVKRVVFPVEILPVQLAGVAVVHQLIATALLLLFLVALGFSPGPSLVALPLLLAAELAIAIGLGWALAVLHVFFRDTAQGLAVVLPIWFYLTPILYPLEYVPAFLRPVLSVNPLSPLVEGYRTVLLRGAWPTGPGIVWLVGTSLAVLAAGAFAFTRARGEIADLV